MMVRNESRVIRRALDSVMRHIDGWCITDTGSDDGTPRIITEHLAGIPGRLHHTTFVDFGTSRSETIAHARAFAHDLGFDYLLLLDADEYVEVKDPEWKSRLDGAPYQLLYDDPFSYRIQALVPSDVEWRYVGRTHEYLQSVGPCLPVQRFDGVVLHDVGDGGSKADKFSRDARLLNATLHESPDDARAWFYLGETHLNGRIDLWRALECYTTRAGMGGFEEEAWYAAFRRGRCLELLPPPVGGAGPAIGAWFHAWERRPWRAEPLHAIVRTAAENGMPLLGALVAAHAIERVLPRPERGDDILFIDRVANGPGLLDWGSLSEHDIGNGERAGSLATTALEDPLMQRHAERIGRNIELFDSSGRLTASHVETVVQLCTRLRQQGLNMSCLMLADGLMQRSGVAELIGQSAEPWRLDFECSIAAYYVPGERYRSNRLTNVLARRRALPDDTRNIVLGNRRFHVEPIGDSLDAVPIRIGAGSITPGYHPTNPTIAAGPDGITAVVRTVNYRLNDVGRYVTPGFVATRNLIGRLTDDGVLHDAKELVLDTGVELNDGGRVRGLEDLRLVAVPDSPGRFRAVANHGHPDGSGRRAMYLLEIVVDDGAASIVRALHLHGIRDDHNQKNWMPVMADGELLLVYHCHPTVIVRPDPDTGRCELVQICRPPMWCGDLRGGSQLVPVEQDGIAWMALVHGVLAESPRRRYFHAWVAFDRQLRLLQVSDPFVLQAAQVEFAAGLVRRGDTLLLSWGVDDASAWFGTMPLEVAMSALADSSRPEAPEWPPVRSPASL